MSDEHPARVFSRTGATLLCVGVALTLSPSARGDDMTLMVPAPAPGSIAILPIEPTRVADSSTTVRQTKTPNFVMIGGGAISFGVSYGISTIAAATSSRDRDRVLFVPVLGPWIDLGGRGACGGPASESCAAMRDDKTSLVVDGIFQGVGLIALVGGIFFQSSHDSPTVASAPAFTLRWSPVQYGRGSVGLAAAGEF
jgi:hypothetical protein